MMNRAEYLELQNIRMQERYKQALKKTRDGLCWGKTPDGKHVVFYLCTQLRSEMDYERWLHDWQTRREFTDRWYEVEIYGGETINLGDEKEFRDKWGAPYKWLEAQGWKVDGCD